MKSSDYYGELEVWRDIYNREIKADVAIYGSSRAWVQIDPEVIEDSIGLSTYNFGIDGHNFYLQYLRHLEYISYNQKPKIIILSVDIFSLQKRNDLYNHQQFLPIMLFDMNILKYTSSYSGFSIMDFFIPFLRYLNNKPVIYSTIFEKDTVERYRSKGFKAMNLNWNSDLSKARLIKDQYYVQIHDQSKQLFEQFLENSQKEGVKVIMVYAPEFIEGRDYISNRDSIITIFNELSNKYNTPFLDYSNHMLSLNQVFFYNTLHLNSQGAVLFSQLLAHDISLLPEL